MRVLHEILLPSSDASVSQNSLPGTIAHAWGYSVQAIITGSAVGTLKLQGSCDPAPDANYAAANMPVVNWTDIADSSQSVTGAGSLTYDVTKSAYSFVRAVYTAASGTGTITIQYFTKGF